jgi:hypothetical protein
LSKPLSSDDFRSFRIVLEPDDFALSSGNEPPPSDLVDQEIWRGVTVLPDDVSVRTSNHHGSTLKILYNLWEAWIEAVGENHDYLYDTILDAADEFQAATYNSLIGYYRQAIGCLRSALELITIGAYCQINGKPAIYKEWRRGKEIKFGEACNNIVKTASIKELELHLADTIKDSIFAKKNVSITGGWARRLYSDLCNYSHTRPGFASSDMWASNGPIYVKEAFVLTTEMYLQVSALCFIIVKLGRPSFTLPEEALQVFGLSRLQPMEIARVAYEYLFSDKV